MSQLTREKNLQNINLNLDLNIGEILPVITKQIVRAIDNNELTEAAIMLRHLAANFSEFSPAYLLKVAKALETDSWNELGEDFLQHNFIGKNGYILLVGPYIRRKEWQKDVKLTAIFGRLNSRSLPISNLEVSARQAFGQTLQPLAPTFAIESIATCGNIGQQEAFLAPDCWCFPKSEHGPALVNLTAHQQRLTGWVKERIRRIFEAKTADLILQVVQDKTAQLQEYWLHEAGHAAGMGLKLKIANDLFPNSIQSGWEEYKTDIAGFHLAATVLTPEQVGQLVAATFCIRFGIDAHRPGGADKDQDVMSVLLILDRLLLSGEFELQQDSRLALKDVSYEGLCRAIAPHRQEARYLIQQELALKDNPAAIMEFYQNYQQARPHTRALFDRLANICRSI
jgi:hypothetical protein